MVSRLSARGQAGSLGACQTKKHAPFRSLVAFSACPLLNMSDVQAIIDTATVAARPFQQLLPSFKCGFLSGLDDIDDHKLKKTKPLPESQSRLPMLLKAAFHLGISSHGPHKAGRKQRPTGFKSRVSHRTRATPPPARCWLHLLPLQHVASE